jgi:hypothetical protein
LNSTSTVKQSATELTAALVKPLEREQKMEWYWWLIIGWVLSGFVALAMEFRDKPAMRINVGWMEVWPTVLGPIWLTLKIGQWIFSPAM